MERHTRDTEERGQVGIGTLIVFIAMVLVAAIAAGVLINTAGFLQTKSQETGEQSGAQVTDRLQLNSITSDDIGGDPAKVQTVDAIASRAPGAGAISLTEVTVQWVGPETVETLKWGDTANGTHFSTTMVKNAQSGGTDSVNSDADTVRFTFSAQDISDGNGLDPGDQVTLRLTTASNGETITTLSVPDSLIGESVVSL